MEQAEITKRCPMAIFGLCDKVRYIPSNCEHAKAHPIEDSCANHKRLCGVRTGCSTIEPENGLMIDAKEIKDFIYQYIGPMTSWYPFYMSMMKQIIESDLIVTPNTEDYNEVVDATRRLRQSIENYKIAQKEQEILEKMVFDNEYSFETMNKCISTYDLDGYGPYRSSLKEFLETMEAKHMITIGERDGELCYKKRTR